jgi:hypothetical protein
MGQNIGGEAYGKRGSIGLPSGTLSERTQSAKQKSGPDAVPGNAR